MRLPEATEVCLCMLRTKSPQAFSRRTMPETVPMTSTTPSAPRRMRAAAGSTGLRRIRAITTPKSTPSRAKPGKMRSRVAQPSRAPPSQG